MVSSDRTLSRFPSRIVGTWDWIWFACKLDFKPSIGRSSNVFIGESTPSDINDCITFNGFDWNCDLKNSFHSKSLIPLSLGVRESTSIVLLQRDLGWNVNWPEWRSINRIAIVAASTNEIFILSVKVSSSPDGNWQLIECQLVFITLIYTVNVRNSYETESISSPRYIWLYN